MCSSDLISAGTVDGMDAMAVEREARVATDRIRAGNGPEFLECRTYRFRAHSMFDAELYRSRAEVEDWKRHCPIDALDARLRAEGTLDDARRAELEQRALAEVGDAVAYAESGHWEPVADLVRDVYTPSGAH